MNHLKKLNYVKNASTLFTLHIFSFCLHLCFIHSCKIKLCGITYILSMLQAQQCLHLCKHKEKKWGKKNKLHIKLHVWELDYILVIFCNSCLFHWTLVCQVTCCGKRNNLPWLLVVNCAVALNVVMSEGKQSILKKSLSACCFALTLHTVHMSIWYMECQFIMLYLQMTDCNCEATPHFLFCFFLQVLHRWFISIFSNLLRGLTEKYWETFMNQKYKSSSTTSGVIKLYMTFSKKSNTERSAAQWSGL